MTKLLAARVLGSTITRLASAAAALVGMVMLLTVPAQAQISLELNPELTLAPEVRIVTIQGVGLRFLDAHEIADRDYGVVTRDAQGNNTQLWKMMKMMDGTWTIQQVSSGRFLDAHEIDDGYDYRLVTRPSQGNATQQWTLVDYGGGFYTIQQASNGRYMEGLLTSDTDFRVVTRATRTNDYSVWRIIDAQ